MKNPSLLRWELVYHYTGATSGPVNDLTRTILDTIGECQRKRVSATPLFLHGRNIYTMADRDTCVRSDAIDVLMAPASLERLVARMCHLETEIKACLVLKEVTK